MGLKCIFVHKFLKLKANRNLVYLLVVLAMIFWGLSFVWTSIVFQYINPVTTVFIRLVISSLLLYPVLKIAGKLESIQKKDYKLLFISALLNPFLYFLGESYGVKLSTPTISAVVIATIPVFSPVAAYFFLHERLKPVNFIGLGISFFGILIMLMNKSMSLDAGIIGVLCLLFAVVTAVFYSIALKKLSNHYSAFTIVTYQNMIGALYFLPFVFIVDGSTLLSVQPDFRLITSILLLAVFGSSLAFVFFAIGTRELGVTRTNIFSNFIPVVTAIFSFFILDERLSLVKIVGIVLVIFGVVLTQAKGIGSISGMYRFFSSKSE